MSRTGDIGINEEPRRFAKLEGCGNDFVVGWTDSFAQISEAEQIRTLLDRHRGVGGDGLLLVTPRDSGRFQIDIFNSDGSEAGMCGNGVRCVVRFLAQTGEIAPDHGQVEFYVGQRTVFCDYEHGGRWVRVNMGPAVFSPELWDAPIQLGNEVFKLSAVSMGNPHCVIFVPDLAAVDFERWGPTLEHHELFPGRTNVEFAQRVSADRVVVKVWERGAGPTLACGSGACATVAVGRRMEILGPRVTVALPGGEVRVEYSGRAEDPLYLAGPTRNIMAGELAPALFEETRLS